ncbi:MAG: hypothetical protein U0802_01675 [Candidatus Binatia bacterium]
MRSVVQLYLALGGGWNPDAPSPAPAEPALASAAAPPAEPAP